jgi:hypothetical protein
LIDNLDDVLRKTNKEKREYRSLLGEAKEKVVELESLLVDVRAQIDSLKSIPVVTNEPECTDCSTFLGELTVLKEKYASKVEELDVLKDSLQDGVVRGRSEVPPRTIRYCKCSTGGFLIFFGQSVGTSRTVRRGLADSPPRARGQSARYYAGLLSPLLLDLCFRFGIVWSWFLELIGLL